MNLNVLKILTVLIIFSSQVFAEENNKELSFYTGTFDVIDKEGDDKTSLFLDSWQAHGKDLECSYKIIH